MKLPTAPRSQGFPPQLFSNKPLNPRYGSGDTRYMRQHASSHATETMLVLSGPFELAAVAMFKAAS